MLAHNEPKCQDFSFYSKIPGSDVNFLLPFPTKACVGGESL